MFYLIWTQLWDQKLGGMNIWHLQIRLEEQWDNLVLLRTYKIVASWNQPDPPALSSGSAKIEISEKCHHIFAADINSRKICRMSGIHVAQSNLQIDLIW